MDGLAVVSHFRVSSGEQLVHSFLSFFLPSITVNVFG